MYIRGITCIPEWVILIPADPTYNWNKEFIFVCILDVISRYRDPQLNVNKKYT